MNSDEVLAGRGLVDKGLGLFGELTGVVGGVKWLLIGMALIGWGDLMKCAESAPGGPPNENLLVSATTLRNKGLLIANTEKK